jgi:hypothetical protein
MAQDWSQLETREHPLKALFWGHPSSRGAICHVSVRFRSSP